MALVRLESCELGSGLISSRRRFLELDSRIWTERSKGDSIFCASVGEFARSDVSAGEGRFPELIVVLTKL